MGLLRFTAWGGYLPGARHVLFACKSPGGSWVAARQGRVACRPGRPLGLAEQPFLATAHGELLTWQSSRPARRLAEEQCDREARKETTSENCVELYRIRVKTSVLSPTILPGFLLGVMSFLGRFCCIERFPQGSMCPKARENTGEKNRSLP